MIHDATASEPQKLFAVAGRDAATGDLLVKAINSGAESVPATLNLRGVARTSPAIQATVLKSATLADNNSLDEPAKVIPMESTINATGSKFQHEFPPYSLTILRLKTQ